MGCTGITEQTRGEEEEEEGLFLLTWTLVILQIDTQALHLQAKPAR